MSGRPTIYIPPAPSDIPNHAIQRQCDVTISTFQQLKQHGAGVLHHDDALPPPKEHVDPLKNIVNKVGASRTAVAR